MDSAELTFPDNPYTERTPRIVNAAKLKRTHARRKAGQFLAEGFNSVDAAIATGRATDVFVTSRALETYRDLVEYAEDLGIHIHFITTKAAAALADTTTPTGLFALCPTFETTLADITAAARAGRGLVAVGVDMSEPGNAGTFIRTADAVGADAVLFTGEAVDVHANKVVRASAGSVFHLPVAKVADTDAGLDALSEAGLGLIATAMAGSTDLDSAADDVALWRQRGANGGNRPLLARPSAWLLGNEAHGLDERILSRADATVSIPIRGRAESLNVASAAAICLYEASRALG